MSQRSSAVAIAVEVLAVMVAIGGLALLIWSWSTNGFDPLAPGLWPLLLGASLFIAARINRRKLSRPRDADRARQEGPSRRADEF